jgi:hypothetical protein
LTALERLRAQRNSKMTNQSQFPQRAETASTSAAATPRARLVQPNKLRLEPASPMNRPPNPIHSPVPPALPPQSVVRWMHAGPQKTRRIGAPVSRDLAPRLDPRAR